MIRLSGAYANGQRFVLLGVDAENVKRLTTGPKALGSNISEWMTLFGSQDVPSWLLAKSADHWVVGISVFLAILYSLIVWRVWVRRTVDHIVHPQNAFATLHDAQERAISGQIADENSEKSRKALSATELLFLRHRRWHAFWAAAPFHSYKAKRRLEFIDSWKKYFSGKAPQTEAAKNLGPVQKVIFETAFPYVLAEEPDAIYHLCLTPEQIANKLNAKMPSPREIENRVSETVNLQKLLSPAPAEIKRDVGLGEALMYVVTGEWGRKFCDADGLLSPAGEALAQFQQFACDGTIKAWGRLGWHGIYVPITPSYWINHHVDLMDLLDDSAKTSELNTLANDPLYKDVMVSKANFESDWPR